MFAMEAARRHPYFDGKRHFARSRWTPMSEAAHAISESLLPVRAHGSQFLISGGRRDFNLAIVGPRTSVPKEEEFTRRDLDEFCRLLIPHSENSTPSTS